MLFAQFDVSKIWSLDLDQNVIEPSKRLYPMKLKKKDLIITTDVNKIRWNEKNMLTYSADLEAKHKEAGKLASHKTFMIIVLLTEVKYTSN